MSETSVLSEVPPRPEDLQILAAHAGLPLSPTLLAELADAWRYIAPMLGRIRRERPFSDEPAHTFVPTVFQATGKETT
ncbi:hypothetical protein [Bordetella genomosp. 11]|nr:hypothetical protein [Bordetella genomosp. 11]